MRAAKECIVQKKWPLNVGELPEAAADKIVIPRSIEKMRANGP